MVNIFCMSLNKNIWKLFFSHCLELWHKYLHELLLFIEKARRLTISPQLQICFILLQLPPYSHSYGKFPKVFSEKTYADESKSLEVNNLKHSKYLWMKKFTEAILRTEEKLYSN